MARVTELRSQQKDSNRVNIYIDGEFYCGSDLVTVSNFGLSVGKEVTPALLEEIFASSEASKIYQRVLSFLARRPRSIAEVKKYVGEKIKTYKMAWLDNAEKVSEFTDGIVKRLVKNMYVDDTEFTRWWIDQRVNSSKPSGPGKILAELRQKGISEVMFKSVWQAEFPGSDKEKLTEYVGKIRSRYDLTDRKEKSRLIRHLLSRGFVYADIQTVLQLTPYDG